ncbi:hypothetical protein Tco_0819809 [Tanacetum coccineum]|uniref:Uncharacterized protein n=1 Tax=Tanacetum coccineum TaxID=301880 RepID=A0ABQ5A7M4_9ASTR
MKSHVKTRQGRAVCTFLRLSSCELWLPSQLVEFRKRAWSIIAWMDSGVMLFGLVFVNKDSLPSVPDVYGQSLEALLTKPAASESESHVPDAVSE